MKNSDCKIPPFSLVYNMYISGLYGASYFVFIAKNAIYCLRVYVYNITILESPKSLRILWLISQISPNFAYVGYNKLTTLSLERGTSVRCTKKLCTIIVIDFIEL